MRDILSNEIPVIFRKEIYATACILGGIVYFILRKIPIDGDIVFVIAGLTVIVFRIVVVKFKLRLPSVYKH